METNSQPISATIDREVNRNRLCGLLDELMVMHWDLNKGFRDNPDLPLTLTDQLQRVGDELDVAIKVLKTLIRERGLPL